MEAGTKNKIDEYIRKHRKSGGRANEGVADWKEDDASKPERRINAKVDGEAEEMKAKRGGRMKRKHGGDAKVEGMDAHHHAGRKRRASGGGCEAHPFTSAKGTRGD